MCELNCKKQIITLDETNKSDIGYIIQQAFSVNQDLSYLEIQLTGKASVHVRFFSPTNPIFHDL